MQDEARQGTDGVRGHPLTEVANLSFQGQISHYLAAWNKNTVILTSYA